MSSTNKTTNLELSQFIGSDKPQWLVDYNGDMSKIDTGVAAVKAQADATDLTVASHTSSIASLTQASSDQASAITALRTDVDGNTGSINTINSLIGNGEPTTTDKTLIGAINELKSDIDEIAPSGGVEADDVAYDNTSSGLTATNVQAAIDEVNGKDASDIAYVNTTSGLTATNVQAAIDEVAAGGAPTLIATSGSGNWGAQIASLQTAYNGLTDAEKARAYILLASGGIYHSASTDGDFTKSVVTSSTDCRIDTIDVGTGKWLRCRLQSSGVTVSDSSTDTLDSGSLTLYA